MRPTFINPIGHSGDSQPQVQSSSEGAEMVVLLVLRSPEAHARLLHVSSLYT